MSAQPYQLPLRYRLSRPVLKPLFRTIFRILGRVKVTGKHHIPFGKPYVVAINHISIFDPPFAAALWPEELEILGGSDVFDKPSQGWLLKAYGVIPVKRGDYDRALLTRVINVIKSGHPLLIAPEGGRSHVPAMRRAKPGISYIVEQTGVPVIPAGIFGSTEDFWQRARQGKRPALEMHIGPPIHLPPISGRGNEKHAARQHNADLVMAHLAALLPTEYHGIYADSAIISSKTS